MIDDNDYLIDGARTAFLCDVGLPGYIAATVVSAWGETTFTLASIAALRAGDDYEPGTPDAEHEQLGPLPLNFLKRIAISRRRSP